MDKRLYILFLFLLPFFGAFAQEVVLGLTSNPVIHEYREKMKLDQGNQTLKNSITEEALLLPFFDDFSEESIYPDPARWVDQEAYVNSSFAYRSVNVGTATMDCLDSKGELHSNADLYFFKSDSLTSMPIRLDSVFSPVPRAIVPSDSVYFSFFYQPQGRGNAPEEWDSLVLQFGYKTGDLVFAGYDSITVALGSYLLLPGDTIFPGDTIHPPPEVCDTNLFTISNQIYTHESIVDLPCDSTFKDEFIWKSVWNAEGMSLQEFYDEHNTYSKQVMIPITDSAKYFKNSFQFRFTNYASIRNEYIQDFMSNMDEWNVDYVYLDINRSKADTFYRDISFVERAPSMLRHYQSMPYNQYIDDPINETKDQLDLVITNLSPNVYNTKFQYTIIDDQGLWPYTYDGAFCNLGPVSFSGYQDCDACPKHACPPVYYIFPLDLGDSVEFDINHIILGDFTPVDTIGDTISYQQQFYNYYAYDDGVPELGYGVKGPGAKCAVKFKTNIRDTLQAVRFYFNHSLQNVNQQYFDLHVWRDNNGVPGDLLYTQSNMYVEYSDLAYFTTYMIEEPFEVSGTFYVGWERSSGNKVLNVGLDMNNNSQEFIYYWDGQWNQSLSNGSLMLRPVMGKWFDPAGIDDPDPADQTFNVYPNPLTGGEISFILPKQYQTNNTEDLYLSVYNVIGQKMIESPYRESLDVRHLEGGIYIIRLSDHKKALHFTSKLVISK